ncbi:DNA topoisomerase I [Candidatus Woesearchaeota archaeon]|jgi:DNA topoisomerase I|nr:DNA topoisomerase I [Candidatus Woesearchaeota archaeon]MBT6044466.1 DNA topoisomerase I [Candidatus Woesearchaeota archaeon]
MTELIFTEKPAQAEKIAFALADDAPTRKMLGKAPYFELKHNGKDIIVGCAVGHLFGLKEIKNGKKGWTYPVFNIEWVESHTIRKTQAHSKPYVEALKKLVKKADEFTVACDYDTEGSVIGYNCVKFIAKKKDAHRMKFSTLTKDELVESYKNRSKSLDFGVIEAGQTRHHLDYFWGISLSRALTLAVKATGSFKLMTSGRVQGPTLKIIVDKEKEISKFKPDPYWELSLDGKVKTHIISAKHKEGKIFDKKRADEILKNTTNQKAVIDKIKESERSSDAPHPFNLTNLQTEAYSLFGYSPKKTLSLAQDIYTAGYISYPRTSSQKLPPSIDYEKILTKLSKHKDYKDLCNKLLSLGNLKPNDGKKTDTAHPAIYVTGEKGRISADQKKVYDLIVRRFLATFAENALRKTVTAEIKVNGETFLAKGTTTIKKGWHEFYGSHVRLTETILPPLKAKDELKSPKITKEDKETSPPKRYTPASILKEMDKLNIGTKATRASILDALYLRNYIVDNSITATKLGMETVGALTKFCPEITDTDLTRHFEEEMEQIMEGTKKKDDVLEEAKSQLTETLNHFREHEKDIGEVLIKATRETEYKINTIADCPKCKKGVIQIRTGRFGKFVACNKYPDCENTYSLPANSLIRANGGTCKECNFHTVLAIRGGKRPFNYCLNKECPPKVEWRKAREAKLAEKGTTKKTTKKKTTKKSTKKKTTKKRTTKKTKTT